MPNCFYTNLYSIYIFKYGLISAQIQVQTQLGKWTYEKFNKIYEKKLCECRSQSIGQPKHPMNCVIIAEWSRYSWNVMEWG